jgi:hypothetical protein
VTGFNYPEETLDLLNSIVLDSNVDSLQGFPCVLCRDIWWQC